MKTVKRVRPTQDTPWISPILTIKDVDQGVEFYENAFGFERKAVLPGPDGVAQFAEVRYQTGMIMLSKEGAFDKELRAPGISSKFPLILYVYFEDVDSVYQRAIEMGVTSVYPPGDMFWGDRVAHVIDPFGYAWNLATNIADFDPKKTPKS